MNRCANALCLSLLSLPALALAQTAALPTFPPDAQPVAPEVLKEKLLGKTFVAKMSNGRETRLQFESEFVYLNTGPINDSGRWRTEGNQLCVKWNRFPSGDCTEARMLGNTVFITRAANGEVLKLEER